MIVKMVFPINGLKIEKLSRPFEYSKMPLINGIQEIQSTLSGSFIRPQEIQFFGTSVIQMMGFTPFFFMNLNASEGQLTHFSRFLIGVFFTDAEIFLDTLWFIKDNACCSLNAYISTPEKNKFDILNNHRAPCNCVGKFDLVEFSNDELERALEIDVKLSPIIRKGMDKEDVLEKLLASDFRDGVENHRNYNEGNRIFRAYYFLKAARNSYFLIMKLSLYMNLYECLFTTDASEIIHKMSERVACYYTQDKAKRLEVFKLIKSAYTIRSRYFHGKDLGKDKVLKSVPEVLKQIDDLTREIFTKVIMEDQEIFGEKDMEPFFEKLIFS
jgi:hypothetical protein